MAEVRSFKILATRSAGADGAVVLFIYGDFAGDNCAPIRIIVNDRDVYEQTEFDPISEFDREARTVEFTVLPEDIQYLEEYE